MFGIVLGAALVRTAIPLAALGYPNGIPLNGGSIVLRIPVFPGVARVGIHFPIDVRGDPRNVEVGVAIDGREVAAVAGEQLRGATLAAETALGPGRQTIDVTLRSRLMQCGQSPAVPEVRVRDSGEIAVTQDAIDARSARGSYAGAFTVIEPQHPDNAWRARALASAYVLHDFDGWRLTSVSLGATPVPGSVSVTNPGSLVPSPRPSPNGMQTFAQLGVTPLAQSGESVTFVVPFTLGQLGGVPNRLVATLRVHASAPGRIDAVLNGREINEFPLAMGSHVLRLPIQLAALRGNNVLNLEVRFSHPHSYCERTPPEIVIDGSDLHWRGHSDIAMTLERRIGELSGRVAVQSDPAAFPQAFITMSTLGSVNNTIDSIDVQPFDPNALHADEIEIGPAPEVDEEVHGSYGEVRLEPNGAVRVSYIGDPTVLDRLPLFRGALSHSDATRFEFGTTGAIITRGGPFSTHAQERQRTRWLIIGAFVVVLVVATWLIARRARRFS